jgi:hypothetical protein
MGTFGNFWENFRNLEWGLKGTLGNLDVNLGDFLEPIMRTFGNFG